MKYTFPLSFFKIREDQPLASVDADFFLTSITENFSGVCNSSGSCFLRPGAHFIFILVEPVAAKDVALYKGCWCNLHQLYAGGETIGVFWPPGAGQDITWIVYPLRTGDIIAVTKEFYRGRTEGSPTAGVFSVSFWLRYGVAHQGEPVVLRVAVPGVPEVA